MLACWWNFSKNLSASTFSNKIKYGAWRFWRSFAKHKIGLFWPNRNFCAGLSGSFWLPIIHLLWNLAEIRTILKSWQEGDAGPESSLNIATCETMSEFDELESKIQSREQFSLLVSKTLRTPLIVFLISNVECAQGFVNQPVISSSRDGMKLKFVEVISIMK